MKEGKPRLSRLAAVITQLQSKRIVTAIVTEEGKGYSIMEGYSIPPVMFTQDEANALITAEQLIKKNKDQSLTEQYENAVTKIKSVLKNTQKDKIELLTNRIQVRNNYDNEKTSNYLIKLQSTISNYQV